jgi:ketosteroid isomerase-like protein
MGITDELRARREAAVMEHIAAETNMDADGVLATMQEDAAYEMPVAGRVFRGPDEIRALLQALFTALPGAVHRAERIHHADDAVIAELATDVPGMDLPLRAVAVFSFNGDVMLGERLFADISPVLPYLEETTAAAQSPAVSA